jgi:hypothetical protein
MVCVRAAGAPAFCEPSVGAQSKMPVISMSIANRPQLIPAPRNERFRGSLVSNRFTRHHLLGDYTASNDQSSSTLKHRSTSTHAQI